MPDNYYSEVNDHGVVVPIKDLAAMTWEANAKTGAHNWFNKNTNEMNTSVNKEVLSTGLRIYNESSSTWYHLRPRMDYLPKNTNFEISSTVNFSSGSPSLSVTGLNDGGSDVSLVSKSNISNGETVKLIFNTGNYDHIDLKLFGTQGTSEVCDVSFTNLMIKVIGDIDDYSDFAMSNLAMTDMLTPSTTSFGTVKGTASVNKIVKTGNIVIADLRTNGATVDAWGSLAVIPSDYRPASNVWFVGNNMTDGSIQRFAFNSDGTVTSPSAISNKEIFLHAMWSTV